MRTKWISGALALLVIAGLVLGANAGVLASPSGQAQSFADPAFRRTWERTDMLVAQNKVKRSYYWGPRPNTGALQEEYAEGPGGKHLVQYFDKSRMEINDPSADPKNPFFVTNGLLTRELVEGQVQIGNDKWVQRWHANIPLASDHDDPNAPTYASFQIALKYEFAGEGQVGQVVTSTIKKDGAFEGVARFGNYGVKVAYRENVTKRGIPDVFWQFLNQSGPVMVDGRQMTARLSDPYFYATGYPISNAFWATVKIANKPGTDVLIQAYERRVLTYVPTAAEGFKVQMGNIGQHYYDWRYKDAGKPGPVSNCIAVAMPERFNKLWRENLVVQNQLLCPSGPGAVNVKIEHFEHGDIIWVERYFIGDRDSSGGNGPHFMLGPDRQVTYYFPDRKPGDPGPRESPPRGLLMPDGEIGKLWRESEQVRKTLGWATAPSKDIRPEERHFFQRGIMVADLDVVFMFYNEDLFHFAYPKYWNGYLVPGPIPPPLTPVTGCTSSVPGEMGKLWSENLLVQNGLNCAIANSQVNVAFQPFRYGAMIYLSMQSPPPGRVPANVIYILYPDGRVEWVEDTYRPGDPEPTPEFPPRPNLIVPRLGFGKVWREKNLEPILGYAVAPERAISSDDVQFFRSGFMVRETFAYNSPTYGLFSRTPGYYPDAASWVRYFTP